MKEALKKLEQQAVSSGFATAVHAVPGRDAEHLHLAIVLAPIPERTAQPGERLPPIQDPVEHTKALLKEAGLIHGEIHWFMAAKDPAVTVFDVGIPAAAKATRKTEPKL